MVKKYAWILILLLGMACRAKYVLVPPAVDLLTYENIGLITFTVENAKGELDQMATQRFLQEITQYQRGVQIIELGKLDKVLDKINKGTLDLEAAKAIGEEYGVSSYFHGNIKVSKVKPQVNLLGILEKGLRAQVKFDISVAGRLISTENGATLWTDSALREGTVGFLSMGEDQIPVFGMRSQDEATKELIRALMFQLTRDFRPSRERM